MSREEARIALFQEYGSNARSWYSVLLGLAIVLLTIVQVRWDLPSIGGLGGFQVTWFHVSLAFVLSQAVYAIIRAVVYMKLAESAVVAYTPVTTEGCNFLRILRDETEDLLKKDRWWRRALRLGSLMWWVHWTIYVGASLLLVLVLLGI